MIYLYLAYAGAFGIIGGFALYQVHRLLGYLLEDQRP